LGKKTTVSVDEKIKNKERNWIQSLLPLKVLRNCNFFFNIGTNKNLAEEELHLLSCYSSSEVFLSLALIGAT
jgi:hypothetical protein